MPLSFAIMFSDLTPECQKNLLEWEGVEKPEDRNWDKLPVVVFEKVK